MEQRRVINCVVNLYLAYDAKPAPVVESDEQLEITVPVCDLAMSTCYIVLNKALPFLAFVREKQDNGCDSASPTRSTAG